MLTRIADFDAVDVSVYKSRASASSFPNYYLQANNKPIEIQSDWLTLGTYPLPGKNSFQTTQRI